MKVYVSALLLTFGVVLHFGVLSSMPSPPRNEGRLRPRNRSMYTNIRYRNQPVFDENTRELVAIFYDGRRINISDVEFEEKNPNVIPDDSNLWRQGTPQYGKFHEHKIYYGDDFYYTGDTLEPQRNDLVLDRRGESLKGIFGDGGRYFQIVHRRTP